MMLLAMTGGKKQIATSRVLLAMTRGGKRDKVEKEKENEKRKD